MMEEFPIKAGLKLVGGRVVPLSSSGEEGDGDGEEGAAFGMGEGEELTPAQAAMLAHYERLLAAGGPLDGEAAPGQFDDAPEDEEGEAEEGAGKGK
jgi:hypothetical protein